MLLLLPVFSNKWLIELRWRGVALVSVPGVRLSMINLGFDPASFELGLRSDRSRLSSPSCIGLPSWLGDRRTGRRVSRKTRRAGKWLRDNLGEPTHDRSCLLDIVATRCDLPPPLVSVWMTSVCPIIIFWNGQSTSHNPLQPLYQLLVTLASAPRRCASRLKRLCLRDCVPSMSAWPLDRLHRWFARRTVWQWNLVQAPQSYSGEKGHHQATSIRPLVWPGLSRVKARRSTIGTVSLVLRYVGIHIAAWRAERRAYRALLRQKRQHFWRRKPPRNADVSAEVAA